jgi:hypothetical protein
VGGRLLRPRAQRATRRAIAGRRSSPPGLHANQCAPAHDEVVVAHGA